MSIHARPWIELLTPSALGNTRLFCFPYAGGGASIYRSWVPLVPLHVELLAIQLPGREKRFRERPLANIDEFIAGLLPALIPLLDRPYCFFGHSLGALLAFEAARHLQARQVSPPDTLFVSACRAPRHSTSEPIHSLPDAEFLDAISRLKGTPAEVLANRELMQLILPVLRADFALYETYQMGSSARLASSIRVLLGVDDDISFPELRDWRECTTATFEMEVLPGDHFFINSCRQRVLNLLCAALPNTAPQLRALGLV